MRCVCQTASANTAPKKAEDCDCWAPTPSSRDGFKNRTRTPDVNNRISEITSCIIIKAYERHLSSSSGESHASSLGVRVRLGKDGANMSNSSRNSKGRCSNNASVLISATLKNDSTEGWPCRLVELYTRAKSVGVWKAERQEACCLRGTLCQ